MKSRKGIEDNLKELIKNQGIDFAQEINVLEQKIKINTRKEDMKNVESAVNEWIEKFESQINVCLNMFNSL